MTLECYGEGGSEGLRDLKNTKTMQYRCECENSIFKNVEMKKGDQVVLCGRCKGVIPCPEHQRSDIVCLEDYPISKET
uniref:Uncharacterized protein n=1 Tax=viral metagenome TaxID=1070528 RepID=A0A6M3LXJ9_9ZZZZ